jgi:flagellar motility protein MotE (MotC chaperone)
MMTLRSLVDHYHPTMEYIPMFLNQLRRSSTDVVASVGVVASTISTAITALGDEAEKYRMSSQESLRTFKAHSAKRMHEELIKLNVKHAKVLKELKTECEHEDLNFEVLSQQSEQELDLILKEMNPKE